MKVALREKYEGYNTTGADIVKCYITELAIIEDFSLQKPMGSGEI